jgi:hypothetical protein
MPNPLYVESSIWPIPLAVEIGFSALGFQADSRPINLVKQEYCSFVSNSWATCFADTCIKGGLSLYTTGTAGVGLDSCNNKTAITINKPAINVFLFKIGLLLGKPRELPHEFPVRCPLNGF